MFWSTKDDTALLVILVLMLTLCGLSRSDEWAGCDTSEATADDYKNFVKDDMYAVAATSDVYQGIEKMKAFITVDEGSNEVTQDISYFDSNQDTCHTLQEHCNLEEKGCKYEGSVISYLISHHDRYIATYMDSPNGRSLMIGFRRGEGNSDSEAGSIPDGIFTDINEKCGPKYATKENFPYEFNYTPFNHCTDQ